MDATFSSHSSALVRPLQPIFAERDGDSHHTRERVVSLSVHPHQRGAWAHVQVTAAGLPQPRHPALRHQPLLKVSTSSNCPAACVPQSHTWMHVHHADNENLPPARSYSMSSPPRRVPSAPASPLRTPLALGEGCGVLTAHGAATPSPPRKCHGLDSPRSYMAALSSPPRHSHHHTLSSNSHPGSPLCRLPLLGAVEAVDVVPPSDIAAHVDGMSIEAADEDVLAVKV